MARDPDILKKLTSTDLYLTIPKIGAFPSLIDMALEAVHQGADASAMRLMDLRDFLMKYFKEEEWQLIEEESGGNNYFKYLNEDRKRTLG